MKNLSKLAVTGLLAAASFSAQAQNSILDFDDHDINSCPPFLLLGDDYHGFDWNNGVNDDNSAAEIAVINSTLFETRRPASNYHEGTVSGDYAVFNAGGATTTQIDWNGTGNFNFTEAYWTRAWDEDREGNALTQTLSFEGWRDGVQVYNSATFETDSAPTLITLNWDNIDSLVVNSTGKQWVMDDFTYSVSAVPEPSVLALMLGGLGLVGFMGARSRRNK